MTFNYSSLSIQNSQTDCDDDDECQNGLICFQRDDLEAVPGCSGEDNRDLDGKDVCVTKCTADYCVLHYIGNNINPGEGHYGRCEVRINSMMTLHIYLNCTFAIKLTHTAYGCLVHYNRETATMIQIVKVISSALIVVMMKMYQAVLATRQNMHVVAGTTAIK